MLPLAVTGLSLVTLLLGYRFYSRYLAERLWHLRGDEPVQSTGMTPRGDLAFSLPGLPPPRVRVSILGQPDPRVDPRLDTVILDFDQMRVSLLWRGRTKVPEGPHDVNAIAVESPEAQGFPRAITDPSADRPAAN